MGLILHHDTTEAGLARILKTKTILPSLKANNIKDARFGDGHCLSDVPPGSRRPGRLSSLFFRTPWAGELRKVEILAGGRIGLASSTRSTNGTQLAIIQILR